jgi:hypothetical protein
VLEEKGIELRKTGTETPSQTLSGQTGLCPGEGLGKILEKNNFLGFDSNFADKF